MAWLTTRFSKIPGAGGRRGLLPALGGPLGPCSDGRPRRLGAERVSSAVHMRLRVYFYTNTQGVTGLAG